MFYHRTGHELLPTEWFGRWAGLLEADESGLYSSEHNNDVENYVKPPEETKLTIKKSCDLNSTESSNTIDSIVYKQQNSKS